MKILLVTYPTSPYRGSEFSVSWNYIVNMSQQHELYVLYGTSGNGFGNVDELNDYLKNNPMPHVHFIDVHVPDNFRSSLLASFRKWNYTYGSYFQYKYWHKTVYAYAVKTVEEEHIDIVHYLNPIGFKEPSECWKIKDIPYVWGPIKAVENRPFSLFKALSFKGKVSAIIRKAIHNGIFIFMPKLKKALKRANIVFAATPGTVKMLSMYHHCNSIYLPENGIIKMERLIPIIYSKNKKLEIIWIGRLEEGKAFIVLLDALKGIIHPNWHLDVIGGGDLLQQMKSKSIQMGIADHITWHGNIPRPEVLHLMQSAHLHVISSLGEGNPTVLWEAMSWAVPTMTLDHCGMAGVVCEKCGIKIPIHSYKQVTTNMAKQIDNIIEHPHIIQTLSEGVIKCSEKFMWSKRIEIFNEAYKKICH